MIRQESSLDRLLIQNCTGYSSTLNRFQRPDLHPTADYAGIPAYADEAALREAGLMLDLHGLKPADLAALALRQLSELTHDLGYLQGLLNGG